jgi:2-methylcitrate dehydratase
LHERTSDYLILPPDTNQVRGLAQYAIDFLGGQFAAPGEIALRAVERFHLDSVACAVSALACGANAPRVLREEALTYQFGAGRPGATCFGSRALVRSEKAVVANCAAVREWDANGTNFGYNAARGHTKGEFGHNDF